MFLADVYRLGTTLFAHVHGTTTSCPDDALGVCIHVKSTLYHSPLAELTPGTPLPGPGVRNALPDKTRRGASDPLRVSPQMKDIVK